MTALLLYVFHIISQQAPHDPHWSGRQEGPGGGPSERPSFPQVFLDKTAQMVYSSLYELYGGDLLAR